jgi:hypothetical protein
VVLLEVGLDGFPGELYVKELFVVGVVGFAAFTAEYFNCCVKIWEWEVEPWFRFDILT